MKLRHHKIKLEEWQALPMDEQLLNIAAEFARIYQGELHKNIAAEDIKNSYERALELIDLTLQDPKWRGHHELYELRDALASLYVGEPHPVIVNFFYNWLIHTSQNI